ncbi:hypothetical protein O3G_MSEX014753 [Manduca sexta]|uniref:PDZ domain-containing protein n=1 Tax=Manduca sexta TaxID=7130 RepID=A0A922CYX4_MANSE|nr:hypothetical protein O3G_MSEX014753 [Manduca sexta]
MVLIAVKKIIKGLTLSGCEQESSNAELAASVREKDPNCARAIYVASDTAGSLFTGAPDGGMVLIAAYWIAHKAVKMVIDDVDGLRLSPHPTHRVWEVIKEHFNADTRADLLPHAYKDFNKSQFAAYWIAHKAVKMVIDDVDGLRLSPHPTHRVWEVIKEHFNADTRADLLPHAYKDFNKSQFAGKRIYYYGFVDGSTHTGLVEDVDVKSDLATLRIPVNGLPTMKLGSSADIKPGEWVVAMGSPLALSNTVTAGVVSSTQRASKELGLKDKDMVYIQTDAPITFGNSGGPLVNLDGEAIGINSMKVTSGISFAIPIDYVKEFLSKRKVKSPQVSKRYLGITMLSLTPNILMELRMRNPEMPTDIENGILVWKVIIGSPAYNGGLQPGDIVTKINGKSVYSATDIYTSLENTTGTLRIDIVRGRQKLTLSITPELH